MKKVSEPQLREYDEAKVISSAKIVRHGGGYVVVIQVNWKKAHLVVFSRRNRPRTWKSLDRLIAHLAEVAPTITRVELVLKDEMNTKT